MLITKTPTYYKTPTYIHPHITKEVKTTTVQDTHQVTIQSNTLSITMEKEKISCLCVCVCVRERERDCEIVVLIS